MSDPQTPAFRRARRLADQKVSEILAIGARAAEPRRQGQPGIVNSVSKAYAMTGWRLGYGAGPAAGQTLTTDREFCAWLLETPHAAMVPGAAFGLSPYFRLSYATSTAELQDAMTRLPCAELDLPA